LHNTSPRSSLYNIYYYAMVVHLHIGVIWNLVALWKSFQVTLLPYDGNRTIEWLCLVIYRPLIEAEWLIAARKTAPSHDGGSMWFMLAIILWLYVRPGEVN
jgi:hypothetical protein